MRTSTIFRISLVGAAVLMVAPAAEAARRFSLAGNALIEDQDDVFLFPQKVVDNTRLISFDYGASSASGDGLLVLGDKYQAWGVAVHRGDVMSPWKVGTDGDLPFLGGYGSGIGVAVQAQTDPAADPSADPTGGGAGAGGGGSMISANPKTVFDILYGSADPGKTSWGLRLSVGSDKTWADPKANGATESFDSEHFLAATFGYSDKTGRFEYDASAALLYDMGTHVQPGPGDADSSRIDLSLTGRGNMPMDGEKDTRLGLLGQLRYGTSTVDMKAAGKDVSDDLRLVVGAGPLIVPNDRMTVAAYGMLGVVRQTRDPNSKAKGDTQGALTFLFPGVNFATEIKLKDWLFFRTGTEYTYMIDQTDVGTSTSGGTATS